jgi:branched-chain amino acid transport system permease protein
MTGAARLSSPVMLGAIGLLLVLPWLIGAEYYLHIAITALVFVILATSLDLLVGYSGLLSLGHTAFFAFGAYAAALLYLHFGVPLWITLFVSGGFAALIAWLLGLLVLSVRGHRFVIMTVVFAEMGRLIAYNWTDLTHGQVGLPGIRPPVLSIPGVIHIDFAYRPAYYYLALFVTVACVAIIWRIADSPRQAVSIHSGLRPRPSSSALSLRGWPARSMPITTASSARICFISATRRPC